MRKSLSLFALAAMIALLCVSCFSIPGLGDFNPLAKVEARANAEVASAVGLTGMTRKMMFNVLYTQIFYMGGFGAGYYPLAETQGTIWRLTSVDADGKSSSVEAERALLKKLPNGDSWWLLSWKSESDAWEFEVLMDKDLLAKKIRYFNADVKRVEESTFDYSSQAAKSDPKSETAPPEAAAASGLDLKELPKYVKAKETVKTGAGSYPCERIEWSFYDEEEKAKYTYTWWVDAKTAGGLVKYEWTKSGAKDAVKGELVSLKSGYSTKFKSF